jgi:hypothetical protein
MESINRPFLTEPVAGKASHRLQFDRRQQAWILETDRDGDGRFESAHSFQAMGATW